MSSKNNDQAATPKHQSPKKLDSQDILELVEDYLCECFLAFCPLEALMIYAIFHWEKVRPLSIFICYQQLTHTSLTA